jgi:hypothetical protein
MRFITDCFKKCFPENEDEVSIEPSDNGTSDDSRLARAIQNSLNDSRSNPIASATESQRAAMDVGTISSQAASLVAQAILKKPLNGEDPTPSEGPTKVPTRLMANQDDIINDRIEKIKRLIEDNLGFFPAKENGSRVITGRIVPGHINIITRDKNGNYTINRDTDFSANKLKFPINVYDEVITSIEEHIANELIEMLNAIDVLTQPRKLEPEPSVEEDVLSSLAGLPIVTETATAIAIATSRKKKQARLEPEPCEKAPTKQNARGLPIVTETATAIAQVRSLESLALPPEPCVTDKQYVEEDSTRNDAAIAQALRKLEFTRQGPTHEYHTQKQRGGISGNKALPPEPCLER